MAATELLSSKLTDQTTPWDVPAAVASGLPTSTIAEQPLATTGGPLSSGMATELFGHVAPPAETGLATHKVKTQTIRNDTGPLLDQIAAAADVRAAGRPTVRSTAGDLLTQAGDSGVTGLNQYAYMLATAERESKLGTDMDENYSGKSRDDYFNRKYDGNQRLGNTEPGDGSRYFGRGLVQITGRRNYTDWTERLAAENYTLNGAPVDLVNNPDLAMNPQLAAKIAVEGMRDGTFTTRKLGRYVNDQTTDYVNARRVVNGTDHADEIADRATAYEGIVKQHSNAFHSSMMERSLNKLPTAREPAQLQAPTLNAETLFSNQPIGGTLDQFKPIEQLAQQPIGKFAPTPKSELPAQVPIPIPRPRPDFL